MTKFLRNTLRILVPASFAITAACGGAVKTQPVENIVVSIKATPDVGSSPLDVELTAIIDESWQGDVATLGYSWNFGDGTPVETGATVNHTYVSDGAYDAKLTVTDGDKTFAATKRIDVGVSGPGIDLKVTSVEATPDALNPGSPLTVKFTLENAGTEPTGADVIVRLYILPTADWPATPGSPTGVVNAGIVQGGQSQDALGTAYVPAQFADGDYYVFAFADGPDLIHESHEDNNVGRAVLPLQVTTGTLPVDIVVDSLTTTLTGPAAAGSSFTVATTLRNTGNASSPAFKLAHRLSIDPTVDFATDISLGALGSVTSIAPGATVTINSALTLPASLDNRPYYLGVIADANGDVAELDENNNTGMLSGFITVSGGTGCTEDGYESNETLDTAATLPAGSFTLKLCPSSSDWFRIDLAAGQRLTSTATFSNGDGNLALALYKDGTASAIASSDGTGNDETVDSGLITAASTWRVKVTASGNAAGTPYALALAVSSSGGNGKDLVPANYTVSPSSVSAGNTVNIAFDVYDFGTTGVTESTTAQLFLSTDATLSASDTLLATVSVGAIAAGQFASFTQQVTIPMSTPVGTWQVFLKVDAADAVAETYEDNNVAVRALGVGVGCGDDAYENNDDQAGANALGSGTISGLRVCTGDEDWYKVEVPAGGLLDVKVLFPNAEGDVDAYIRDANGSTVRSGTGTSDNELLSYTSTAGGTYYIRVKLYADHGTVAGNGYSLVVDGAVSSQVDLSPSAITFTPATAHPGEEVQVDFTVRNLSTMASPSFETSIRLSMDATIDGSDTEVATVPSAALGASGSATFSKKFIVPASVAGNTWRVGVFADPTNQVAEASETNNGRASTGSLNVPMPCTDDMYEENDNAGQSKALALATTISNLKVCGGDEDWFKFTAGATGSFTVRTDFVNASGDLDLAIFDATGATLLANSSSAANDFEQVTIQVTSGTSYVVRIRGFNGASNTYSIRGGP